MQRVLPLVFVLTVLAAWPRLARADDPPPASDDGVASDTTYHDVGEGLWISGVSVLAASYVLTGAVATTLVYLANARDETIAESWIPVVGPWIMLGDAAGFDGLQVAATVVSGILQTLSLAALITGLVLVNEDRLAHEARIDVAPLVSGSELGLGVGGRF